jgi:hypothetical protein
MGSMDKITDPVCIDWLGVLDGEESKLSMTREQIEQSIETGELQLTFWDKFTHYSSVWVTMSISIMFLVLGTWDFYTKPNKPPMEGAIWFIVIPPIISWIFYKIQRRALRLKSVETDLTRKEIDIIIKKVAKNLEWKFVKKTKKVVIARTHPSFITGSYGERITILFDGNRVLVNSICDPDKSESMVSAGRNHENVQTLIEEIKMVSK